MAAIRATFMRKFDVIVGTLPQPFAPLAGYARGFFGNTKFILEVRDLWPEGLVGAGVATESSLSYRLIGATSRFLYRKADLIVTVTDGMRDVIVDKYQVDPETITTVETGVDVSQFQTPAGQLDPIIKKHTAGKFVVSYVGTIGNAHDLKTVTEAAELLEQSHPGKFAFVFAGGGAEEPDIRQLVKSRNIQNVLCTGLVDRDTVPDILRESNLGIVSLKQSDVFQTVIPTKIYEYMATGLRILSNVSGQAEKTLERSGAGITIPGEDAQTMATSIAQLATQDSKLSEMGKAGFQFGKEHASWDASAAKFLEVMER
jgi:colanic acid biosynthesis glycosyl transferase WcaI